jgi:transcriptional regulator with GAF, ATPase, and Fis domain
MLRLQAYRWPGNIRELENVIERAIILSDDPILEISPEMLPGSIEPTGAPLAATSGHTLEGVERHHIHKVLDQADWVIEGPKGAAQLLGLHPSTLRYRMKKLGLKPRRR